MQSMCHFDRVVTQLRRIALVFLPLTALASVAITLAQRADPCASRGLAPDLRVLATLQDNESMAD